MNDDAGRIEIVCDDNHPRVWIRGADVRGSHVPTSRRVVLDRPEVDPTEWSDFVAGRTSSVPTIQGYRTPEGQRIDMRPGGYLNKMTTAGGYERTDLECPQCGRRITRRVDRLTRALTVAQANGLQAISLETLGSLTNEQVDAAYSRLEER